MRLLGIQIANGFSPEARVFAHLLEHRSSGLDAAVVMHDQPDNHEPAKLFAEVARCPVALLDTGWRANHSGVGRGALAKLKMGARYAGSLKEIDSIARKHRPDVVYSCQQHYDLVAASRVADSLGRPQIIHLHYIVGPWLKQYALKRLLTCDHVITVSDFIRDEALRHGVSPERVTTILNAMEPFPAVPADEVAAVRTELGISHDAYLFGIVSRLDPYKGHADTIAAFSKLAATADDAWLAIVGSGTIEEELKAQAAAAIASDRIVFTGRRNDVPRLLAAFDAFVHPSRHDPCPLALLEALASGLAVAAYAEGGAKEVVADGVAGLLVPAGDMDALSAAMRELYDHPERTRAMGASAKERIKGEFRPGDASAKFERVIQRVVERNQ